MKKLRAGVVLGLSGGIDSTVCAALSVLALGAERVLGILMPEAHSTDDSTRLGQLAADHLGIATVLEVITPALEGVGCYQRQISAIRRILPEYGEGCAQTLHPLAWTANLAIVLPSFAQPLSRKPHAVDADGLPRFWCGATASSRACEKWSSITLADRVLTRSGIPIAVEGRDSS